MSVQLVGMEVMRLPPCDATEGRWSGTGISLLANAPWKSIIEVDEANTQIDEFRDDTGRDLSEGVSWSLEQPVSTRRVVTVAPERGVVIARSDTTPAHDARRVHIRGRLVLLCGSDPKIRVFDPRMKAGTSITSEPFRMSIDGVDRAGELTTVKIGGRGKPEDIERLIGISFQTLDDRAIEIESETDGGGSESDGKHTVDTMKREYELKCSAPAFRFSVHYYSRVERCVIPFDFWVGIGL